jgi:hypothetical protein
MGSNDAVSHSELLFVFFLTSQLSIVLKAIEKRFGNWICFRPQVKGRK